MTNLSSSYRNNGERPSSYEVFSCMLDLSRLRTNRRASHLAKRAEVAQVIAGCGSQDVSSQMPVLSSQFCFQALSSEFSDQFPVLHCVTCDNYGTVCRIEFAAHIGRSIGGLWSRLRCISPTRR